MRLTCLDSALLEAEEGTVMSRDWVESETAAVSEKINLLEIMEMEVWTIVVKSGNSKAHNSRSRDWLLWSQVMNAKIAQVKREFWKGQPRSAPAVPDLTPAALRLSCGRSSGHLEKVRLPNFSGKTKDYTDFKLQFQLLCGGEKYPEIIEITQLRLKVPKEAALAIAGLTSPAEAWSRLNELYGGHDPDSREKATRISSHKGEFMRSRD